MASKKERLRTRLREQLDIAKTAVIDAALAQQLRAALDPVSDSMYRDLLRECGLPLSPMVEGVRQDNLDELERTLLALAAEYEKAGATAQRQCRRIVIDARNHARLAAANANVAHEKRALKEEMVLWMLTWLENPPVFELWAALRKQAIAARSSPP